MSGFQEASGCSGREDDALVPAARAGSEEALAELAGRYLPLVRSRAARFAGAPVDMEDLVQEGLIGFLKAVRSYDPGLGASFGTYAYLCIDRTILSAVRETQNKKKIPSSRLISFSDITSGLPFHELCSSSGVTPEEAAILREDVRQLESKIEHTLSGLERNVLHLYLGGHSYSDIAQRLQTTTKVVDNALQRVRHKLR